MNNVKRQLLKILLLKWFWKGGFQLIHILGLLGMYFDAVVVEVKTFLPLFRLAQAILCRNSTIHANMSTADICFFLTWLLSLCSKCSLVTSHAHYSCSYSGYNVRVARIHTSYICLLHMIINWLSYDYQPHLLSPRLRRLGMYAVQSQSNHLWGRP